MKTNGDNTDTDARGSMAEAVGRQAARKQKARREGRHGLWFGFGMFGLVGWAVAVPTLVGIAVGLWLDSRWPARFSWTIALLLAGVFLGCVNAWWWVQRESRPEDERKT
ncbi:MAG: ATPase F0F1 [Hyphomicrobiales bacterium]|nr:ATPase F0F1 [Hyphomicrobiales bacterium]